MKTSILYLVGQLSLGGLERQLWLLLRGLRLEGYQPELVVWNFRESDAYVPKIRDLGIKIREISPGLSRYEKLNKFRNIAKDLSPELIHSYTFYTNFAAWWGSCGLNTISVGSIRNNFLSDRKNTGRILGRLSARWPHTQICNSLMAKQAVAKARGPFKPNHLSVVRNRLAMEMWEPSDTFPATCQLLAVGRLVVQKRWDRLLKILAMAKDRGLKFSVLIAGEGPLLNDLVEKTRSLGIERMVQFIGPRNDISKLLANSRLLIHTADAEGCPNVVMEAMACGRAVLATDAGDIPLLVDDGKTGFVVPRGQDGVFLERLETVLNDPGLLRRMGEAGRIKAEQEFGEKRLVRETLDAYREIGWRHNIH